MGRRAGMATVCCVLLATSACGRPRYSDRFLTERPETAAVVGVYGLDEQSVVVDDDFTPPREPELRLLADGRFEARAFPLWRRAGEGWQLERTIDATGVWRVIRHGSVRRGPDERTAWGVTLTAPVARMAALGHHEERMQLIFVYGEVERGRVMVFTRR